MTICMCRTRPVLLGMENVLGNRNLDIISFDEQGLGLELIMHAKFIRDVNGSRNYFRFFIDHFLSF